MEKKSSKESPAMGKSSWPWIWAVQLTRYVLSYHPDSHPCTLSASPAAFTVLSWRVRVRGYGWEGADNVGARV